MTPKIPMVVEFNASLFPVMTITLSGDAPERTLLRHARHSAGCARSHSFGFESRYLTAHREEILEVIVDPSKLESYNISPRELLDAVTLNNRMIAAGVAGYRPGPLRGQGSGAV